MEKSLPDNIFNESTSMSAYETASSKPETEFQFANVELPFSILIDEQYSYSDYNNYFWT